PRASQSIMRALRVSFLTLAVAATAAIGLHAQLRGVKADLTPIVEASGVHPGTTVRAALDVKLPDGFHVQSNKPRDPSLIPTVLTVTPPAGVTVDEVVFPPAMDLTQQGLDQPLAVFEQNFVIGIRLTLAAGVKPGDLVVPATLRYQACDASMCYVPTTAATHWTLHVVPAGAPVTTGHADVFGAIAFGHGQAAPAAPAGGAAAPETTAPAGVAAGSTADALAQLDRFTVLGTSGGYLGSADFLKFIHDAESGVKPHGMLEGRGVLTILLIVFFGGLALNLTPCVLPMIPINLAIIGAGAQSGSRMRGFLLGGVYGAAMAIVYGVLGLVVILTAGTFGTINASPWFNLAITVLFVLLGLAMFDVFAIDFSRFSSRFNPKAGRGTFILAFSMGAVAALLAGACVAPVVIQVVLFSSKLYASGTTIALALPFLLGVGMALPWPLAGAGIAALPKPGAWMVRVEQAFGVLILIIAAYYGYETYGLFANRWVDPTAVTSSVQQQLKEGWDASLTEGLATAEREQKPVLIDFWATWCKNCLTMDRTTLEDADVKQALSGFVKIKFQAEQPDEEPAKSVMQRFNAVGLPTYVILRPKSAAQAAGADR
ncbi:MAG TPA: cytochrome c biogenesis protein CcdA, partial [Vicinamibacterales bacterium]|nr:cytochrome c biogenesis protein CcdA [Vicinamibacterales bacterium]